MAEEVVKQEQSQNANAKPTRIWGIIGIVAFVILGGIGFCPWYLWIVVALLALITFGGTSKGLQILFTAIVIIWGTPLFSSEDTIKDIPVNVQATSTQQKQNDEPSKSSGSSLSKKDKEKYLETVFGR